MLRTGDAHLELATAVPKGPCLMMHSLICVSFLYGNSLLSWLERMTLFVYSCYQV